MLERDDVLFIALSGVTEFEEKFFEIKPKGFHTTTSDPTVRLTIEYSLSMDLH